MFKTMLWHKIGFAVLICSLLSHCLRSYYDRNHAFEYVQKQSRRQYKNMFGFKKTFRHERALTQLVWAMDKATQNGKCTLVEDSSSEYDQTCRLRDPIWVCSPTKNGDCKKMTYISRRPDEVTCQRLNMDCGELNGDNRRAVTSSGPSPPPPAAAGAARKRKKYNELTSQEWIEAKPAALREIQKLMRELDVPVLSVRDNGIGSTWDTLYAWAAISTDNTKRMMQSYAMMSKRHLSGASANGKELATPNDIRNSVNAELRAANDFMTFHETIQETLMSPAKEYHDMAWTDPFHNMHAEKLEAIAKVKEQLQPSWMVDANHYKEQATAKLNAIADVFSYAISWLSWVYSWNECIAKKMQTSFGKDDEWALKHQQIVGFGLVSATCVCFLATFTLMYYIVYYVASWFVVGMTQILWGLVVAAGIVYLGITFIGFAWDSNYDPILLIATMFIIILGFFSYAFPEPTRATGDNRSWLLRWLETFAVWLSVFVVWLGSALGVVAWFDNMYVGFGTFALTAFLLFPCLKMKRFGDIGPALLACKARLSPAYWKKKSESELLRERRERRERQERQERERRERQERERRERQERERQERRERDAAGGAITRGRTATATLHHGHTGSGYTVHTGDGHTVHHGLNQVYTSHAAHSDPASTGYGLMSEEERAYNMSNAKRDVKRAKRFLAQ